MIVTAGAGDGGGEKGLSCGINLLVDKIEAELAVADFVEPLGSDGEEAGGYQILGFIEFVGWFEKIAGELLSNEFIKRFV